MKTNFNKSRFRDRLPGSPVAQLPIDYAVQFGDPKRDYDMKAYPFWYNFIKSPYQIGTVDDSFGANQAIGIYRVTSGSAEGPDGLTLVAGGILDIPIVMDNDTNFHMLYLKYGAFRISSFIVEVTVPNGGPGGFSQPTTDPFVDGDRVVIDSFSVAQTNIFTGISYFVVLATATEFQVSLTSGGADISPDAAATATIRRQGGVAGSREYLLWPITNPNPPPPGMVFSVATLDAGNTFAQPGSFPVSDNDVIILDSLTTTTGPTVGGAFYVISAGAGTFQISLTLGGAAIGLVTNGSATFHMRGILPEQITNNRIPYWTELDVSLYMPSSMNRDIYGGFQRQPIGGATEEAPIPILNLQGKQDGLGMLKTAFQLTKSATVWIRVRSRSAFPLQVYGHVFGYKITE